MDTKFTWIPIYKEIARKLLQWEDRQSELIAFLEKLRSDGLIITPLNDKDDKGARFLLKEIDPFTFMGVWNRGIRKDQRFAILEEVIKFFGIQAALPTDFSGIPLLNNQKSWLFAYQPGRGVNDVKRLWTVFKLALADKPLENPEFLKAFDEALEVPNTNINLTMGLFWVRPEDFLNLDGVNREYLNIKLPSGGLSSDFYVKSVRDIVKRGQSLFEISHKAWEAMNGDQPVVKTEKSSNINYWMVGAYWAGSDPQDQTQRFLEEGVWENGYDDKFLDEVKSINVGDKIAIKAAITQKNNLPFDARGNTVSKMVIKAVGTVIVNRNDGTTVEVEWDLKFKPKDWYFYTNRTTLWALPKNQYSDRLIDFVFFAKLQDYDWFLEEWYGAKAKSNLPIIGEVPAKTAYSIADIVESGIFLSEDELEQTLDRLKTKKNLILQGPPGVGKTFLARKLAYALIEEIDDDRIEMVQFHQSYSYEDFIRGYRPLPEKAGTFGLKDGVFFTFCEKARKDPENEFVFIIDEINRGNLSQIFGELLMLIEADKRDSKFALPLVYQRLDEARFHVPANVHLIGLMNVADRSLAMVDYALRRRFAFLSLKPQFAANSFRKWLEGRSMGSDLVRLIVERMGELNHEIATDSLLGENYSIGHSFFCPRGDNFKELDRKWFESVVKTEIVPLLEEYWFDNAERAKQLGKNLLRA
jgi:5-methylcytosine-specific restriction protein B